jgi:pimeloyl-ACP methyl ester carboxylesterase
MTCSENTPQPLTCPLPNGLTLRGLRWGNQNQPAVLALHGWMDNAATFAEIAPALATDYQVVALELAGHGWSDHRPFGGKYHLLDNVDDIVFAIETLDFPAVHLLGHSMGAAIAGIVAAVTPERVQSLVCLDGLGPMTMTADQALTVLQESVQSHRQNLMKQAAEAGACFDNPELAVRLRTRGLFPLSETAARHLTERSLAESPSGWFWRTDSRLKCTSPSRLTENIVHTYLQGIQAPCLLLGAESGYFGRMELLRQRAEQVRRCEIRTLPGGHHFHLEPDTAPAVAEAIRDFWRENV